MSFDYKITDLKYKINSLMPKNICESFIKFYEDNSNKQQREASYKYDEKKMLIDNFKVINLSEMSLKDEKYKQPLQAALKYISIILKNYEMHIQQMCPNFDTMHINRTSNIRIIRYKEGEFIKDHSDISNTIRGSCTINLNEDYEGGQFRFFGGRVKEEFKTGDGIIFPAEPIWIHGTEPVTKGTRYSINCFLHK